MLTHKYRFRTFVFFTLGVLILVYAGGVLYYVYNWPYLGFIVFPDLSSETPVVRVSKIFDPSKIRDHEGHPITIKEGEDGHEVTKLGGKEIQGSILRFLALKRKKAAKSRKIEAEFRRGGARVEATVEVSTWSIRPALIWLSFGLILPTIGFLVYRKNPRDKASILFYLISICWIGTFVGGINWHVIINSPGLTLVFLWTASFIVPLFLHFCLIFPEKKRFLKTSKFLRRFLRPALYVPTVVFLVAVGYPMLGLINTAPENLALAVSSPEVRQGIAHEWWTYRWIENLVYSYLALTGVFLLASIACVVHSYVTSSKREVKEQMKYVFWGVGIAAIPLALSGVKAASNLMDFATGGASHWMIIASFVLTVGYALAIVKYRLMDIDIFINRSIVYFVVSSVLFGVFLGVYFIFTYLIFGERDIQPWKLAALFLTTACIAMIFRPIFNGVQGIVNRWFYRDRHEYQETTAEISNALVSTLDLNEALNKIVHSVDEVLHVKYASVLLWDDQHEALQVKAFQREGWQEQDADCQNAFIKKGSVILDLLEDTKGELVLSRASELKANEIRESLAQEMRHLRAEIILPLLYEGKLIGALNLGEKLSGDFYTSENIQFLETLSNHAAIAIHNASSYHTIEQLNKDLRDKVHKIEEQRKQIFALQESLVNENLFLREELREKYSFDGIVGASGGMKQVLKTVEKVADTPSAVLIRGETGTGKELIAHALHLASSRRDAAFVPVNCAAIPEGLLESELFGHEKGAFTNAFERKIGKFEFADGGTIFLDEIGEVSSSVQTKLLRVLQEKELERVGGNETIQVDVRIIASTNRDLESAIREDRFREDLFYRLNVIPIFVPSLRERSEDILPLALHFLNRYNKQAGKNLRTIDDEAIDLLLNYRWPGNVRELENMIERAVVLGEGKSLTVHDLDPSVSDVLLSETAGAEKPAEQGSADRKDPSLEDLARLQKEFDEKEGEIAALRRQLASLTATDTSNARLRDNLEGLEKARLEEALAKSGGNKAKAARALGLPPSTFYSKLKRFGLLDNDKNGNDGRV